MNIETMKDRVKQLEEAVEQSVKEHNDLQEKLKQVIVNHNVLHGQCQEAKLILAEMEKESASTAVVESDSANDASKESDNIVA